MKLVMGTATWVMRGMSLPTSTALGFLAAGILVVADTPAAVIPGKLLINGSNIKGPLKKWAFYIARKIL